MKKKKLKKLSIDIKKTMAWQPYTKPINEQKIISWLSIFSSLCQKDREAPPESLADTAHELVCDLYKKYPAVPDKTDDINEEIQIITEENKKAEPFGDKDKVSLSPPPKKPWHK